MDPMESSAFLDLVENLRTELLFSQGQLMLNVRSSFVIRTA